MLDPRVYRSALPLVLLALLVGAFSLQDRPSFVATPLAPDAFDEGRTLRQTRDLAERHPDRRAGSPGDEALADDVAAGFREARFDVTERTADADTPDGRRTVRIVAGVRPGLTSRRIVVVADRAALEGPAEAALSGTAALLELARVYAGRTLDKTLVLVSTSGAAGGDAGAEEIAELARGAERAPVEGVLVLGALGAPRVSQPVVLPWSTGAETAPLRWRRSVEAALRRESSLDARQPGVVTQFARLAVPLTLSGQGGLVAQGLPAVQLDPAGEAGPAPGARADGERLRELGRTALRIVIAVDDRDRVEPGAPTSDLVVARKVVPSWAVRLVVAALLLPALLAVVDGAARVRRRGHGVAVHVRWTLAHVLPFLLALLFLRALEVTGLLDAPGGAVTGAATAADEAGLGAAAATALVLVLGWVVARPVAVRLAGVRRGVDEAGGAAGALLVLAATAVAVWIANPYAAALLVPALHAWAFLAVPDSRVPRLAGVAAAVLALAPLALVAGVYASAWDVGPAGLAWSAFLAVAGGAAGWGASLTACLLAGVLAAVLHLVRRRAPAEPAGPAERPTVRGPVSYAGPGSLGGTESALRR